MTEDQANRQIVRIIRQAQRSGIQVHGVLFIGDQEPVYPGTCRDEIDREAHP